MDDGDVRAVLAPARDVVEDALPYLQPSSTGAGARRSTASRRACSCRRRSSSRSPRPSPACSGDTVSNVTKPATLETGAVVQVPLFVNVGDRIKVDPREGRYISARRPRVERRSASAVPALVDTTIRLLGQEPLAGRMPTARAAAPRRDPRRRRLRLPRGLGRRRLRHARSAAASRARGSGSARSNARTKTPLAMALRGRFLVGSRPVGGDFVRRFVASRRRERHRRLPPARPAERRRRTCARPARRSPPPAREFDAGLVYSSGCTGETDALVEQARKLPELGAARVLLHDPSGSLQPHRAQRARRRRSREASGLPVGLYCQGAGGNALAAALEAARARRRPDRLRGLPGRAHAAPRLRRGARATALAGLGLDTGVDVDALWRASDLVDEHIGDEPVTPLAPRIAVRAAEHELPAGLVAALDAHLRAHGAGDRLDEVLDELGADPRGGRLAAARRADRPDPRLAGARCNVLSASRYQTVVDELRALIAGPLRQPARADRRRPSQRAVELIGDGAPRGRAARRPRRAARRGRRARLERGGAAPARALRRGGRAAAAVDPRRAAGDETLSRRRRRPGARRADPRDRAHRPGVGRRRGHDRGGGHARLGPAHARAARAAPPRSPPLAEDGETPSAAPRRRPTASSRVEAPMVGVFYRAPQPGAPPFVEEGDAVAPGQTLCILEAMKLMNEIKADVDGIVRAIHVEQRASRSSSASCCSSSSRSTAAARRASDVHARPRREPRRDRGPRDPRAARARRRGGRRLLDRRRGRAARAAGRPRRLHRAAAGRARATCSIPSRRRGRDDDRLRGRPSRLRLPRREPGVRRGVRGQRPRLRRARRPT